MLDCLEIERNIARNTVNSSASTGTSYECASEREETPMPAVTENFKLARMPRGDLQAIDELDVHSVLSLVVKPPRPEPEYIFTFQLGAANMTRETPEKALLETRGPVVDDVESMLKTSLR